MSTPKIDSVLLGRLWTLREAYEAELAEGDYTPGVQKARSQHVEDFLLFLGGRFSPATEKGKRRRD